MMKKIAQAIVILSAGVMLILRYLTYRGFETMDKALMGELNTIAYVAAGVCLLAAAVWVLIERKQAKQDKQDKE